MTSLKSRSAHLSRTHVAVETRTSCFSTNLPIFYLSFFCQRRKKDGVTLIDGVASVLVGRFCHCMSDTHEDVDEVTNLANSLSSLQDSLWGLFCGFTRFELGNIVADMSCNPREDRSYLEIRQMFCVNRRKLRKISVWNRESPFDIRLELVE